MKINNKKLPDFMIIGAAKSGSTAIYNYLNNSKDVFLPLIKEPHFFSLFKNKDIQGLDKLPNRIDNIQDYQNMFINAKTEQLIGEGSQSYLYNYRDTISNIKKIYGNEYRKIKIIIILRNPIERAWSQYWHFKKNNNEPLEFIEAIKSETIKNRLDNNWNIFYDYIGFGMYLNQIKAYQNDFDNVKIYIYDEFKKSNEKTLNEISHFLKVPNNFFDSQVKVQNISGKHKSNIYGLLWKVNLLTSHLQSIKGLFPKKFRQKASNALMNKALERQYITPENFDLLKEIYQDEIIELSCHLNNKSILRWLEK